MQMMVGVDLAKSVFQLHGATMTGEVLFRKKLTHRGRYYHEYTMSVDVTRDSPT